MKIAITGANGFIGKHLTKTLVENNHEILTITRRGFSFPETENFVTSNYENGTLINRLADIDCLIHLAAKTHSNSKLSKRNLANYRMINVENTRKLCKVIKETQIKRFVYLSSIKVNGEETNEIAFFHSDEPNPSDAYGISKREAELLIKEELEDSKVEWVIIRPPLVWSPIEAKGNIAMLKLWLKLGLPLLASNENKRDIISISNLCELISLCVEHHRAAHKTFLVSDGKYVSSKQLADMTTGIKSNFNQPSQALIKLLSSSTKLKKLVKNLEVDIEFTKETLGWDPKHRDEA